MVGVEQRPGGEQFAEGSASDQTLNIGLPFDLEGNISVLVQQERAKYEEVVGREEADVYIRSWMHHKLYAMSSQQLQTKATTFLATQAQHKVGTGYSLFGTTQVHVTQATVNCERYNIESHSLLEK